MFEKIIGELSGIEEVAAIALGGSRTRELYDESSDYDLYVYATGEVDFSKRKEIFEKYCDYSELNNQYWETEDVGTMKNGINIEVIYRDFKFITESVTSVVNGNVSMGYTTCFWDNLVNCKVLYDEKGELQNIINKFNVEYPHLVKDNLVAYFVVLGSKMSSFENQVIKSVKRNDLLSINHRLAEYMALYIDILYAINEELHKGEKRMLEYTKAFDLLPKDYELLVNKLFACIYNDDVAFITTLRALTTNLHELLTSLGYDLELRGYDALSE